MGIVAQLKNHAPKARVVTVNAYAEKDPNNIDWSTYQKKADFVILTKSR